VNRVAQHPAQGFIAALGAVAVLSIMDTLMKHLVLAIGLVAVSIWRAAANLAFSTILYLPSRRGRPDRKAMRVHVARGIIVTIMAALFFWGIGRVPLAQAIALTFIAPLLAMLLAAATLDERIGARSLAGALCAFAGVILIVLGQARSDVRTDVLLGIAAIIGSASGQAGSGAAIGAGTGLLFGSVAGADYAGFSSYQLQRQYDASYAQCMYARGNRVPARFVYRGPPRRYAPAYPPDYRPPDYAPPT
jgi:drug/metabolite transporter (DMT)-like permease